jgi:hypothetical protein
MSDTFNPTAVKGDTISWVLNLTGPTGGTYDIGGCTFNMQVRKSYHPSGLLVSYVLHVEDGDPVVPANGVEGGLAASATGGILYVTIGSTYSQHFSQYSSSFYDIQMQYPNNGGVITLLRGSIETLPDVTIPH